MQIAYRLQTGITDKDTLRLPVSADMITGHHASVKRSGNYTILDLAVFTAEILAYTTLSRVSEYLSKNTRDKNGARAAHALRSNDVMFEFNDGAIVASHEMRNRQFAKVVGSLVNIRSAKNDPTGRGHRYYFPKSTPGDQSMYCITWVLWNYAKQAKPEGRNSFFYIPAINWTLIKTRILEQAPTHDGKNVWVRRKARVLPLPENRRRYGIGSSRNARIRDKTDGRLEI